MIEINRSDIAKCYYFAKNAWKYKSQSLQQFGTKKARKENDFLADQITGKLAELIFKYQVERHNPRIQITLDFNHYIDKLHTDNGDVSVLINNIPFNKRIDIKGSSAFAQWLLVEEHKYMDYNTNTPMSDIYVLVKFTESMPSNPELRKNPAKILELDCISGQIKGWATHNDFKSIKDKKEWFTFNRGDNLWKPKVLPLNNRKIKDIAHLKNYINKVIQNNDYVFNDIYMSVPLDAEKNIGLPITWLNSNSKSLFQ